MITFFEKKLERDGNLYLLALIILSVLFCFWKLNYQSVNEWDEARNGVNAFEMYFNHDYCNLFFNHQPDTWNAKPPLLTWMIVICYKIFGFNEFALRLPSALSTVVFFIFLFRLICLYEKPFFAFAVCIILFSCKGIIGVHSSRTGDFDALLLCFLIISLYHFLLFFDFEKKHSVVYCGMFLGLAFYTKGFASLIYLPAIILYAVCTRRSVLLFKNKMVFLIGVIYFVFVSTWIVIQHFYGNSFSNSFYHRHNQVETMWNNDVLQRLTGNQFPMSQEHDSMFLLKVLDTKMNIWNYLFYISILILTFLFFLKKISFKKNKLLLLSGLTFFTIAITLSFPANVHWWYLMPVFPFAAILLVYGISELQIINSYYKYLFLLLALFLGIRQFIFINNPDDSLKKLFVQNELKIRQAAKIIYKNPKQDVLLYAEWNSDGRNIVQDFFPGDSSHKVCIIYDSSQQYFFGNGFYTAGCFKNTCIKFNF